MGGALGGGRALQVGKEGGEEGGRVGEREGGRALQVGKEGEEEGGGVGGREGGRALQVGKEGRMEVARGHSDQDDVIPLSLLPSLPLSPGLRGTHPFPPPILH